ncbi:hypothetical protein [Yoonia sp. R2-816]|uniref:hypothetical protein n=1 Tax=Yoonia sp. R2-816 TaxID=3342638 RepID=UPI00372D405B
MLRKTTEFVLTGRAWITPPFATAITGLPLPRASGHIAVIQAKRGAAPNFFAQSNPIC